MFSVPQKTLRDLINQVHFAMAVHDIRYYLNGILFVAEGKSLTLVATDGHRLALAQATLEVEIPKQEVILPRKTVLELQRLLKDDDDADRDALRPQPGQVRRSPAWSSSPSWSRASSPTTTASSRRTTRTTSRSAARRCWPSLQRAAILTSEKFKGVRVNIEPGHAAHRVEQRRAGRGEGRARDRLRRRRDRDRLQRHLPDRRAGQHGPGDGQASSCRTPTRAR